MLFNLIISDRAVLSTSLEINVMTTHTDEQSIISRGRAAPARDFCFQCHESPCESGAVEDYARMANANEVCSS